VTRSTRRGSASPGTARSWPWRPSSLGTTARTRRWGRPSPTTPSTTLSAPTASPTSAPSDGTW
jgi:hypothetical protein